MQKSYTEFPMFFKPNRVYRVYTGGLLMDKFRGMGAFEDNDTPEEWIASTVRAINDGKDDPMEGLSVIEGTDITLREVGEAYPQEMYGPAGKLNVLVKYLDSAIRLPLQAHPDRAYSNKYFQSDYGKTESWLVLAVREGANICFGFKDKLTKEQFAELAARSKEERHIMDEYLNKVPVKPGDVFLIPAKAVHAIGAGCLILEVQEPTDFTISPEYWCGDHLLSDKEMYLGLSEDVALDVFDYSIYGEDCIKLSRREPKVCEENADKKIESLITPQDTPCFSVNRCTVKTEMTIPAAPAIYIVTEGCGEIAGEGYSRKVRQGDYFFMPYNAKGKFRAIAGDGQPIELVECLPPEK